MRLYDNMTTKHTQGEWEVHDGGRFGQFGESGPSICAITGPNSCQPLFEICGPAEAAECSANAHLAAAAPDLLAGAMLAAQALELASDSLEVAGNEDARGMARSALIELRAAIAKANIR